jgi:hypothetical protein
LFAGTNACYAQVSFCFQSTDGNKLNLKLTLIDKDWKYGYIRYNNPEYGIFIRQKLNHFVDSYNNPGLKEYVWEEVRNDTVTGTYQFMVQAEQITNIKYLRAVDKKEFRFEDTHKGIVDCECNW